MLWRFSLDYFSFWGRFFGLQWVRFFGFVATSFQGPGGQGTIPQLFLIIKCGFGGFVNVGTSVDQWVRVGGNVFCSNFDFVATGVGRAWDSTFAIVWQVWVFAFGNVTCYVARVWGPTGPLLFFVIFGGVTFGFGTFFSCVVGVGLVVFGPFRGTFIGNYDRFWNFAGSV